MKSPGGVDMIPLLGGTMINIALKERSMVNWKLTRTRIKTVEHHWRNLRRTDEKQAPSLDREQEVANRGTAGEVHSNESDATNDLHAAKVAAMEAAELVNMNLVGVGFMTTDQKKKLLLGNKKNTTAEETSHQWDTTLFGDRERQEKFNKLMGVKGELKVDHKPDNQDGSGLLHAEKQKELQLDLEKQYTAGLRRRDGRTVGLGL
ncbi:hypothetical protein SLEP1_g27814 [Rubroshorea leprosula]|uniref:Small acidic protein-like domain-containing protein n=1 Tax=Rubroshorea leprosula TaxID=152421 RepID=A0AAV5JX64_9ROSI|nr:hypothetical protein SLEP1_g27814 [Rubroshorea leprosula]